MSLSSAQPRFFVIAIASMACFVCSINGQSPQQHSAKSSLQISDLQKQIKTAEGAHATPQQLATLWIALAHTYQQIVDFASTEDAFAHAIRLVRGTGAQDLYIKALDGIASVYSATGRPEMAERSLLQAVELEHAARDSVAETVMRRDLAVALIAERKYTAAEKQATEALHLLEATADPNVHQTIVVYLTRSRAVCEMRRCEEALQDVDRAESLAVSNTETDPVVMLTITALRGVEQFRSGAVEQGDRTVLQALNLIDSRTDLPIAFQRRFRVGLLEEYSRLLGSAHHMREKKKIDEEIARTKAQLPGCNRCTVSVSSLGLFP